MGTTASTGVGLLAARRALTVDQVVGWIGRGVTAVWLVITYAYILFAAIFVVYLSVREDPLVLTSPLTLKWFVSTLTWNRFLTSMTASLTIAAIVTILACIVGTCAALALTRYRFRGSQALMSLFMAPLALPQMVLAIGIMLLYTRIAAGSGFRLTNTVLGVVIAHTVVTVPWTIRTIGSVLLTLGRDLERAAQGLGASPLQSFFAITLPLLYRGMLAGAVFAFVISFGNLELSLMVYPPSFEPLPVMMYDQVRGTPDYRIAAIATITMVVVGSAIALVDRLAGIDRAL